MEAPVGQRLRAKLEQIRATAGAETHHALHRETVSAEPRLVCDSTLEARACLAAQPPMAHDAFNWLDQLPALAAGRDRTTAEYVHSAAVAPAP